MEERVYTLDLAPGTAPLTGPFRVLDEQTIDGTRRATVALSGGAFEDMLRALIAQGIAIRSCDAVEPDLEDAFARIVAAEGPGT
jgi:hypothetical protein